MNMASSQIQEEQAEAAFSKQSGIFDALYSGNTIVQYKRARVRDHVKKYLSPNSTILELNSGTGEDAIWFVQQGHIVHATDISAGMQLQLKQKIQALALQENISTEQVSFTDLQNLQQKKQYDLIFSNFAGLNCTGQLDKVLHSFNDLLKPDGIVTLVILPRFCLWEFLLLFKGQFKTAFRRWFSKNGVTAHIEGEYFTCWYYDPAYIKKKLQDHFEVKTVEGLCTIVPPSYIESFAEKRPGLYAYLKMKEEKLKCRWPWKSIGDYYIISLQKKT